MSIVRGVTGAGAPSQMHVLLTPRAGVGGGLRRACLERVSAPGWHSGLQIPLMDSCKPGVVKPLITNLPFAGALRSRARAFFAGCILCLVPNSLLLLILGMHDESEPPEEQRARRTGEPVSRVMSQSYLTSCQRPHESSQSPLPPRRNTHTDNHKHNKCPPPEERRARRAGELVSR